MSFDASQCEQYTSGASKRVFSSFSLLAGEDEASSRHIFLSPRFSTVQRQGSLIHVAFTIAWLQAVW